MTGTMLNIPENTLPRSIALTENKVVLRRTPCCSAHFLGAENYTKHKAQLRAGI